MPPPDRPTASELVAEARKLDAAATPGPWVHSPAEVDEPWVSTKARGRKSADFIAFPRTLPTRRAADATLIARARELLPLLADALETSTEDAAQLRRQREQQQGTNEALAADLHQATKALSWAKVTSRAWRRLARSRRLDARLATNGLRTLIGRLVDAHEAEDGPALAQTLEEAKLLR